MKWIMNSMTKCLQRKEEKLGDGQSFHVQYIYVYVCAWDIYILHAQAYIKNMRQRVGEGDEENDEKNKEDQFLICVCVCVCFLKMLQAYKDLTRQQQRKLLPPAPHQASTQIQEKDLLQNNSTMGNSYNTLKFLQENELECCVRSDPKTLMSSENKSLSRSGID